MYIYTLYRYTCTAIIGIGRFHPESMYIFSLTLIGLKISSLDLPEIHDHNHIDIYLLSKQ